MGEVYKAEHRLMRRTVALKVISKQLTASPSIVERFRRETRAVALLSHPNLVQAYDAEQAGEWHFLVMEFIEGVSLAALVERDGPLPVEKACDGVRQAALGLAHALEQGLVHRDIKPQNLMLTPEGQVKVLDFGLASIGTEQWCEGGLTAVGQPMGTPDYVAPEQIRDAHSADTRADVYSLGCTLYFLLTGQPPFPGGNLNQKLAAHLERDPEALATQRMELPPDLVRVVERMMAKDPAARFQTPSEVVSALEPFCQPTPERSVRPSRFKRWWVAAAALLALAGTISLLPRPRTPHDPPRVPTRQPPPGPPGEVHRFLGHVDIVDAVVVTPDGKFAVSGGRDGRIRVWDVASGKEWKSWLAHKEITGLAVSPDGRFLLSGGAGRLVNDRWIEGSDFDLRLWDLTAGKEVTTFPGHVQKVHCVAFSPDGQRILSAGLEKGLRLWDVSGMQRNWFGQHCSWTHSVAFAPDGVHAVSGHRDRTIRLWDLTSGQDRIFLGHEGPVTSVIFSADGRLLLSGSLDGTLRWWDVASGKQVLCFEKQPTGILSVALSPDGRYALSTGGAQAAPDVGWRAVQHDQVLRLWDAKSGQVLRPFSGHIQTVTSVAFLRDGYHAVSASCDGTVRLWRLQGTEEPVPPPPDHGVKVLCDATQAEFDDHAKRLNGDGFRCIRVHGHDAGGKPRYASIAIRNDQLLGWDVRPGYYQRDRDEYVKNKLEGGFRPLCGTAYPFGGTMVYGSAWVRDGQPAGSLQFDVTAEALEAQLKELLPKPSTKAPQLQRPAQIDGYATGNGCSFVVLWEKDEGIPYRAEIKLTAAEYTRFLQAGRDEGYRPISASAYVNQGRLVFAAVLVRDQPKLDWADALGLTAEQFRDKNAQMMADGYKPVILSGYWQDKDRTSRYLAVWLKGNPPKPPLPQTGKAVPALRRFDEAMQQFMQERSIRAGTLAVVKEGRLVLSRGYGYSDREGKREVLPDDPFAWPASPSRSPPPPSAS